MTKEPTTLVRIFSQKGGAGLGFTLGGNEQAALESGLQLAISEALDIQSDSIYVTWTERLQQPVRLEIGVTLAAPSPYPIPTLVAKKIRNYLGQRTGPTLSALIRVEIVEMMVVRVAA